MKLTKGIALIATVLFLLAPISAGPNQQKIYSLDSDLYEAIQMLYISQGLSLPSTTGPYSQAELSLMMEKVDARSLDSRLTWVYEYVQNALSLEPKIQGTGIGLSWGFEANLESYLHTNTTDFSGRENWIRGFKDQKPLINVALETWPSKNFYGYSEFSIGNMNTLKNTFGSTVFGANVPMVPPSVMDDIDFNMPYRAFVAAGGDHWTFQLGRDRLNWGAGTTGNLSISDTFKYHNLARFTSFSDRFKYTFVTSFFPHPLHYFDGVYTYKTMTIKEPVFNGDGTFKEFVDKTVQVPVYYNNQTDGPLLGTGQGDLQTGLYMFMSHRLEGRLFKDKVGLALTESIMYQSEENYFDLRFLNPAGIFHSYYIRSNSNSILSLELDYTPIKGLNLYVQGIVDEFSLPGEDVPSATVSNYPETFGFLGGAKGVLPMRDMVGHGSLEIAYTDPYLYLRYAQNNTPSAGSYDTYGLNYVGVIREFTNSSDTRYNPQFLGYTYGNDALVVNLNAGVKRYGKWAASANLFYMAHGTFDMFTVWSEVGGSKQPLVSSPTSNGGDALGNYLDSGYASRNAVSHTVVAGVKGSYQFIDSVRAFGQLDYITVANYKNIAGKKTHDVQLSLGLSYSI